MGIKPGAENEGGLGKTRHSQSQFLQLQHRMKTQIDFADTEKSGCGCFFWVSKGVIQVKTQSKTQEKPARGCPQPSG